MSLSISMQGPSRPGESPQVITLSTGDQATFGTCGCGDCGFSLSLEPQGPYIYAGRIIVRSDHWCLDNLSTDFPLVAEDLEKPHEYLSLLPKSGSVPVPFEMTRIYAAGTSPTAGVTVSGTPARVLSFVPAKCPGVSPNSPTLSPGSTYYKVLVTLCRPRLDGTDTAPLPTAREIAEKMTSEGTPITERAVVAHIDYLIDRLLLQGPADRHLRRRNWKRELLARAAIKRGLVQV